MIIVNSKLPPEIHTALKKFTDSVIPSPVASKLPRELSAHPDMLIHVSPKGLICAPELHAPLKALGVDSIKGGKDPMLSYPEDIPFNCFYINKALICNKKHTDTTILDTYRTLGYEVIHTNQGYASCSTLRLGSGIITADRSIATACEAAGAEALLISPGGIELDGYSYGFIGGCGGTVGKSLLLFGDPLTHPDGKQIVSFAEKCGFSVSPLCNGKLSDYGGIIEYLP